MRKTTFGFGNFKKSRVWGYKKSTVFYDDSQLNLEYLSKGCPLLFSNERLFWVSSCGPSWLLTISLNRYALLIIVFVDSWHTCM